MKLSYQEKKPHLLFGMRGLKSVASGRESFVECESGVGVSE